MNKKLIILSIIGVILIGIIGGMSYAYFTIGDKEGTQEIITSGTMSLLFTDGQEVSANNLIPGEYIEKTFKVKNTGNVDTRYDVYFSEVINTFVDKTDLVYTLTSNDGGYNTTNEVQVPSTETKIVNQQLITPNAEHTYTLRITFKLKQTIQNANMGRTFTAKININEYNSNTQEKLLKLIDASGNEVDKQIVGASQTNYTLALSNTDLTSSTNIYCNNGGIPTISGNTLNVADITNDTICTISNDIVDTINNKTTTTKTGIVMTNSQNDITVMTIPTSKEVVLDLNGKNILAEGYDGTSSDINNNHIIFLVRNADLTINDSIGSGRVETGKDATIIANKENARTIVNGGNYAGRVNVSFRGGNSYVEINGGTFTSKIYAQIYNNDADTSNNRLVVNGGTFTNTTNADVIIFDLNGNSTNSMTINDCNVISEAGTSSTLLHNGTNGVMNINGGTFTNNGTGTLFYNESGTINIKDVNVTSNGRVVANIRGTVDVDNGTYNNSSSVDGMFYNYEGSLNIDDGTVTSVGRSVLNIKGNTTINNGTYIVSGLNANVYNNGTGSVTINDGTFKRGSNEESATVSNSSGGTVTINGGYYEGQSNYQALSNNGNSTFIINNANVNTEGRAIGNNGSGTFTINDGVYNVTGSKANIYNDSNGTININGGKYDSINSTTVYNNNANGIINVTAGTFASRRSHVFDNHGILNFNQTTKKVYASTKMNAWRPVINNADNSYVNIKANIADNCTNNPLDTTSGLCIYAEGDKHETNNTGNGALQNVSNGVVKIDGGSYFGWHQGLNNNSNGFIYIKNALVMSHRYAVLNNNLNSTGTGAINICDSTLRSDVLDFSVNTNGIINYNSNTIFTNNTNVPVYNSTNTQAVITVTDSACTWPSN